ncbi:hypothetical protein [Casimicrobium huifangae]|uniref:hypothetical protein n=1 Tax=Casimicrobium huifangae TaxID=2591109 RepID=UPI0037845A05
MLQLECLSKQVMKFSIDRTLPYVLVFVTSLLVGCASIGSKGNFQPRMPTAGEAMVYMIRPYDFEATMLPVSVRVDGESVGSLALNEGVYLRLSAGQHVVAVDPPIGQFPWSFPVGDHRFELEPGKQYVLSLRTSAVGATPERSTVSAVYIGGRVGVMPVFGKEGGVQKGARWEQSEFSATQPTEELLKIGFRERR